MSHKLTQLLIVSPPLRGTGIYELIAETGQMVKSVMASDPISAIVQIEATMDYSELHNDFGTAWRIMFFEQQSKLSMDELRERYDAWHDELPKVAGCLNCPQLN